MRFNPKAKTPELNMDVSLARFHRTHDKAEQVVLILNSEPESVSVKALEIMLETLKAAQALTDAESGSDAWRATSYIDQINFVEKEIEKQKGEI